MQHSLQAGFAACPFLLLSRPARWHVESDAIKLVLANVIEAHARLPMARFWGEGLTASGDGQFFPTTRRGEAMNLIKAKYGNEPGLKSCTHVSEKSTNVPVRVGAMAAWACQSPPCELQ